MNNDIQRIKALPGEHDAWAGKIEWSPTKSIWISSMYLVAISAAWFTFSWEALGLFISTSALTLLAGHSLGLHRCLIHRSYECPLWLEYVFVYLGTLVGIAGPLSMMKVHDLRDWAQRQEKCHSYLGNKAPIVKDWFWQLHCDIQLYRAPDFTFESSIDNDKVYRWLEKTWMWQQLPWAVIFFYMGGIDWVVWGICMRIAVCVTGHWLVGYFAHNQGDKKWHVEGAAVQGYNIKYLGLITMGECWHNNHHAFPGSAKLGLHKNEADPGWWVLIILKKLGLVWNIKLPKDLPYRPELKPIYHPDNNYKEINQNIAINK